MHLFTYFVVVGNSAQAVFEYGEHLLEIARFLPDRTRYPVKRAQFIEDRSPDFMTRIGFELESPFRFEGLHRLDEPENAGTYQVAPIDRGRQIDGQTVRDELHQIGVFHEQLVFRDFRTALLELPPQVIET